MPRPTVDPDVTVVCLRCGTGRFSARFASRGCGSCGPGLPGLALREVSEAIGDAVTDPVDDYGAAEILFELRWGRDWSCKACGHRRCTHLRTRPRLFECNACGHAESVTAGTTLHRCRVPLPLVVKAARLLCRERISISARSLARELGVTLETAWSLAHRLRAGFLDLPPVRLTGQVLLSPTSFRARAGEGRCMRPWSTERRTRFTYLWDLGGHVAAVAGWPEHQGLRRFIDRHADVQRPLPAPFALPPDPGIIGNRTHHGVSDRWLSFYVHAIAGWRNALADGEPAVLVTLRSALRSRRFPFARLRPRAPPTHDLKRWRPELDEYYPKLVEWGLTVR